MPAKTTQKTLSRSNPPHNSYRHIAVVFVVLAVILILGVTYLALSKVDIELTPSNDTVKYDFTLTIADNPATNTSTEVILAGSIMSETSEVKGSYFVESGTTVEAKAEGTVTLYNERSTDQTLVATTRLLSSNGVLFRLKDKVTVPAGSSIQAKVEADEKGADGNIPPTTFTIPGLSESLQKIVYAKSTSSMVGGTRQVGVLTNSDIEQAEQKLKKDNSDDLIAEFFDTLGNNSLTLIDIKADLANIENSEDIGTQVDSFDLNGDLTVTAVFADKDSILELAENQLKDSLGSKGEFVNPDPGSLAYELISVDTEKKEAKVKVMISGLTTLDPEKNIFDKNLLVGFTEEDLKLYFSQFESIESIEVKFSPFWVKKVPILKDHININVK